MTQATRRIKDLSELRTLLGGAVAEPAQREDWKRFQDHLERYGVRALYHFTDRSNLESIRENGGLYSWRACDAQGITVPCPGGDLLSRRLDERRMLGDYVRLSFTREHPMMYYAMRQGRIRRPVLLEIDPAVIFWASTLFCGVNATQTGAWIGGGFEDFRTIDIPFALGGAWSTPDEKSRLQAEVLVRRHIPLHMIMRGV